MVGTAVGTGARPAGLRQHAGDRPICCRPTERRPAAAGAEVEFITSAPVARPAGRGADRDRASPSCCRWRRRPIRPGAARGSNRSKDCVMSDRRFRCRCATSSAPSCRATAASRCCAASSLDLKAGRDRGPGRPVGQRQVDPAAHRRPARAAGRRRDRGRRQAGRHAGRRASARRCAASSWASSTSITTCCRSSRRWRT